MSAMRSISAAAPELCLGVALLLPPAKHPHESRGHYLSRDTAVHTAKRQSTSRRLCGRVVGRRLDHLAQRVEVIVEGGASFGRDLQPGARPLAHVSLADGDVPGLLEGRGLTGEQRVADLERVAQE